MREKLQSFIEHKWTTNFILAVIIFNSILLGVMTDHHIMEVYGHALELACHICVYIFTIELFIKLYVYKKEFFKDGWNNFDFFIVAISWVPTGGAFSSFRVFRILRALRALRLVSQLEKLRIIVQAIIDCIPNVGWASVLLMLVFYIFAIMGTTLFGVDFPVWFGSIGKSMYTLFQIMTLDSWSSLIGRSIMQSHPFAWTYFIPFILLSSFIVMNVIVGVVVNAISEISANNKEEKEINKLKAENVELEIEFKKLRDQMNRVERILSYQKEKV